MSNQSVDNRLEIAANSKTASRLISGNAYRLGMRQGLLLLGFLKADPYKAKSPETSLDLDEIATHAAQSVVLSCICVSVAIVILILQLFISISYVGISWSLPIWFSSLQQSNWLNLFIGSGYFDEPIGTFIFLDNIAAAIIAYELVYMRWAIAKRFLRKSYKPGFQLLFAKGIVDSLKRMVLKTDREQNVITFGGFKPFLGAGKPIENSDVAISIHRRPARNSDLDPDTRISIPLKEFYDAVDNEVSRLEMPEMEITSQLFVKGFELAHDNKILAHPLSKPISVLSEDQVWNIGQGDLRSNKRAYRLYRYVDYKRSNVLSYFLRFHNTGGVTFVEAIAHGLVGVNRKYFTLTPLLEDRKVLRVIKTFLVFVLFAQARLYLIPAIWQFGMLVVTAFQWWRKYIRNKRAARLQEEYDYGLEQTFREAIAAPFDASYYGNQDLVMYWSAIQQSIFKGVLSVLKKYEVDTSQFETSIQAIVNNGVLVTGGQLNAKQVSVGTGIRAKITQIVSRANASTSV